MDCDAERMMGLRLCFVHDTLQEPGYITVNYHHLNIRILYTRPDRRRITRARATSTRFSATGFGIRGHRRDSGP